MKTNTQTKSRKTRTQTPEKGLLSRPEQSSTDTAKTPETATTAQSPAQSADSTIPHSETVASPARTPDSIRPYVNFSERDFNRTLSVEKVLEKLKRWMPAQYDLAEVVGKWVWITFPEQPVEHVRADLSQLGFHWNNTRKCWQHPCGETLPRGTQEPREKYPTYMASAARTPAQAAA